MTDKKTKSRKPRALVVKQGEFPHRRTPACCSQPCKQGDSVMVIPIYDQGEYHTHIILHRRCMEALIMTMPLDKSDYIARFEALRNDMITQGDPFTRRIGGD